MSSHRYDTIGYDVDGHTATITLNRPDALNALSPHMINELRAAYDEAENDDDIWLMIVTGTGRAFCTGPTSGDSRRRQGDLRTPLPVHLRPVGGAPGGHSPFRRMAKPVLAAINGICCGAGLDWVTTGDIVIASDKATFFDPTSASGWSPRARWCGWPVLPRTVALRMALTGKHERMSAERAYELGMVTEVVPHDTLLERAHQIADIVNSNAPLAVRGTRLAIHKTLDLPLLEGEILAETFRERVVRTEDAQEGPRAFVEKRKPNWQCR